MYGAQGADRPKGIMMTTSRRRRANHSFAALIDGDNVTQGGALNLREMGTVLGKMSELVDGVPTTFAMQWTKASRYMNSYSGFGWGLHFVSLDKDAADRYLLERAKFLVANGCTDLVVASGDHAFVELADEVRLHVLAYKKGLSRELRMAATDVYYIDEWLLAA